MVRALTSLRARSSVWMTRTLVPALFPRFNPLMLWLLKSPLHGAVDWYVMLVCFDGRRSGRHYEVPLAYQPAPDGALEAVTSPRRVWWRNLRDGDEVALLFRGRTRRAMVAVVKDDPGRIEAALRGRDACRRMLVPVAPHDTVLLRFHLVPEPALGTGL